MYFVNPKTFFSSCLWWCWYLHQQCLGAKCGVRLAVEATFFFFLVVHIPAFLGTNCLKRNAGIVFWKYFSEPCTTKEVKNLRILRWGKNCGNLSPSPYFVTVLTHWNLFLKTKIKNVFKKELLCCFWACLWVSFCEILQRFLVLWRDCFFPSSHWKPRYKVECVYCLNLYSFFLSCCQQLTETEMGSRNLNIWEYLCLSLCPKWNKIWNT